jgi:hypothetical protein
MASSVKRSSQDAPRLVKKALVGPICKDIPALASDRICQLYAEAERRDRIERTNLMIDRAQAQL